MDLERTLSIIKPDAVLKNETQAILKRYVSIGLKIVGISQPIILTEEFIVKFYEEHRGKPYFEGLVLAMLSGPCVLVVLEGENAIQKVRELNGATDPRAAAPGTIRHDFPSAGGPFNMVHGSDSPINAEREIAIFSPLIWPVDSYSRPLN